jgi:hypothetical protein
LQTPKRKQYLGLVLLKGDWKNIRSWFVGGDAGIEACGSMIETRFLRKTWY